MITEDYVSFEVAKLLKEKGFPQEYDLYHSMVYNEEDYENEYEVQRMALQMKGDVKAAQYIQNIQMRAKIMKKK